MDEEEIQTWYDEDGKGQEYIPDNHVMSDSRYQLEEVLDEIRPTETYAKTIDFITSVDDDGKVLISENPGVVKLLNDDMQSGIFQKALDEAHFRMDRGLLPKQSILQSYIQVMQDQDFYDSLTGVETPKVTDETTVGTTKKKNKEVVSRKKRASNVGTSKSVAKSNSQHSHNKDVNKMSDDEFEDFYNSLDIDD
jgi:hypothetical protein